jgi:hypothetical protein
MIGFIIGLILGLIPSAYYFMRSKPTIDKYHRRGIYNLTFDVTRYNFVGEVDFQFEIGELECTTDMSKIEVISVFSNKGRFNSKEEKKIFKNHINHSWVKSNKVNWIISVTSERNKKIEKILGK